ncbi:MAG TPA: DUF2267 domain-containing protein [Bdellovibrionales bacterium]|nr:DUF2267 domain-containing protein [Bdellovibrionales bacterium]
MANTDYQTNMGRARGPNSGASSSSTGVRAFDNTIQKAMVYLNELSDELGLESRERAYSLMRAVLHVMRDIVPQETAVKLGAQLPLILRGMYYDGWSFGSYEKCHSRDELFERVRARFSPEDQAHQDDESPALDPERVVRAVNGVLARHLSLGEIEKVRATLHESLKDLWPGESVH